MTRRLDRSRRSQRVAVHCLGAADRDPVGVLPQHRFHELQNGVVGGDGLEHLALGEEVAHPLGAEPLEVVAPRELLGEEGLIPG